MWSERARHRNEEGAALVFALLAVIILAGLSVVFVATAVSESRFTGNERDFEASVHVAEAGTDDVIVNVNDDLLYVTEDGAGDPHVFDPSVPEAEWVRSVADAAPSDAVIKTGFGEGVGIRALEDATDLESAMDVVYGVGYVPSRAEPDEVRIVRVGIEPGVFGPEHAFLSNGDIILGGTAETAGIAGHVHSNKNVLLDGKSWFVDGNLTASDEIKKTDGTVLTDTQLENLTPGNVSGYARSGVAKKQNTPDNISALTFRNQYRESALNPDPNDPAAVDARWWDLCPGGEVRVVSSDVPCDGAVFWNGETATFHGWAYDSTSNLWNADKVVSGSYYVHEKNARIAGTEHPEAAVTVLVSSTKDSSGENDGAGGANGNFILQGGAVLNSAVPNVQFIADRDIELTGGSEKVLEGLIAAHEQVRNEGDADLTGSVYAEDAPHTTGSWVDVTTLKGDTDLSYDGSLLVPLSGVTRITSWQEL